MPEAAYLLEICPRAEASAWLDTQRPESWLSADERALFETLKIEKRLLDWTSGRLAAKRAVRKVLGDPALALSAVEILNQPTGQPYARHAGQRRVSLSLSHCEKGGIAAAKWGPDPIGIDWELVAEREERVLEMYIHKTEQAPTCFEATKLWAFKEAVLKFLGLGLGVDPRDVRLSGKTPILAGGAAARWKELGSPELRLDFCPWGEALIAVAY
jgi:4'-phosphopantetheinyl transferase